MSADMAEGKSTRGLIISPVITTAERDRARSIIDVGAERLRFYLLFWDLMTFGENVAGDPSAEVEFLQRAGILEKTPAQLVRQEARDDLGFRQAIAKHLAFGHGVNTEWRPSDGADAPEARHRFPMSRARASSLFLFRKLEAEQPGVWSLACGDTDPSLPADDLQPDRGVLFRLFQAIPVPDKDVPLDDILAFRARRESELIALRVHLERIFQRITQSPDFDLALRTETDDLQNRLIDLIRVTKESKFRFQLIDFQAKLNLVDIVVKATMGHLVLGNIGAILGGVSSVLKVDTGFGLRKAAATKTPFEYVSSYHRKLF